MASTKINIDLALNTKGFRPLGRINGLLGEFEKSLDASNARVLAFGFSAGAILAVKKAFTATVKAAIEVEKSLKDINVILQVTSGNLKKFGSDLFKIASDTGQAFSVAATAATELARQGLGVAETLKRTRDALILARLSGMDAAEAVNSLTAALNTFTKVGLDSTAIINKLANVDAAFAVSSDDLAKALGRVGASAKGAGVSLDELLAIVTTTQQKTARGGAVIGNSFKTIFTRIQRPRVIKELENLGIAVKDLEGDSLPAIKVLTNLARQFDNLSQSQRAQITELVGGVFQVNILKAAMSDLSKEQSIYNRALDISIGSSDQAIRRNEELNQTLAAQFQKTLNTFKEAAAELGTLTLAPALENIFGSINKTFEAASGESDLAKAGQVIAKSVFEGIGKFIGGPGLIIIGAVLFKTFANLATFAADAFKTLTGLNKTFQTQLNLQKQIFNVLSDNPDLMNRIKRGTLSVEDAHDMVLKKINAESSALEKQLLISSQIANQLARGGVAFSPEFGATTGGPKEFRGPKQGRRGRGRSGGYIPNFAGDEELMGMMMGGYSRSQISNPKVKRSTIHNGSGGAFSAFTNGHENIVDFMNGQGKKSTAVIPPKGTSAFDDFMGGLSGGYVPNFAVGITKLLGLKTIPKILSKDQLSRIENGVASGEVGTWDAQHAGANKAIAAGKAKRKPAGGKKKGPGIPVFDAQQAYGVLSLFGDTNKNSTIFANTAGITKLKGKKGLDPKIAIKNFQQKSFEGAFDAKDSKTINPFAALIKKHFAGPLKSLSNEYFGKILGLGDDKPSAGGLISSMKVGKGQGGALFPKGAEGSIFEATINAATKNAIGFERSLRGSQNATWDFEEGGRVNQRLKDGFGFGSRLQRADGKRSVSPEAMTSLANKMFTQAANFGGPGSRDIKNYIAGKAGGYMPSLHNAVQREKSAGVPAGRIRIGSSASLASGLNPMGLGVYNTRDEPGGLRQGIRRSLAGGRNPRHAGVPNFATPKDATGTGQMMKLTMVMLGMNQVSSMLSNSIGDNTTAARQVQSGLSAVEKAMMAMVTILTIEQLVPERHTKALSALGGKNIGSLKGMGRGIGTGLKAPFMPFMPSTYKDTRRVTAGGGTTASGLPMLGQEASIFRRGTGANRGNLSTVGKGWQGTKNALGMGVSTSSGSRLQKSLVGSKGLAARGLGGIAKGAAGMGPLGVAAAGVGAVMLTDKLMNETFNTSFKELGNATKNFESISEEAEKNIGALSKFGAATEAASKVFYDTNATMGQVMQAQKELAKFSKELPASIKAQISGVIDPKHIASIVEKGIVEQQKHKGQAQSRLDIAKNTREVRAGWFDITGASFRSEKELGREERSTKRITDRITGGLSEDKLAGLDATQMESLTKTLKSADSFGGLTDWGGNLDKVESELLNLFDRSQVDDFIKAMEEGDHSATTWSDSILQSVLENRRRIQEERATAGVRKELIKQTRDASRAVKEQKQVIELEQKIRKETIKISQQAAGAFLTATGKIGLQAQTKLSGLQEASTRKFGDVISQTSKAFGSTRLAGTGLGQRVMSTISGAARGGAGTVNQQVVEAQTKELRKAAETAKDEQKDALLGLASQLETLGATSRNQYKELQMQTYETRRIAHAQIQAAAQAKRLKSFGGGQALLDPKSLNSVINQITGAERSMGINARAGSRTGFNRASANRFAGMQTLLGGELPPAMREKAMKAATQVKIADISLMNKRFGLGLSGRDIKQRAGEQAAELFKGEPLDRNNKNLESLNRTLFENNALLAAAQNSRIYLGSIEAQNAQNASSRYQWFKEKQGDMTKGAGREFAGWQGYAATIQSARSEGAGGDYFAEQAALKAQGVARGGAMRMATNNTANTATTVNMYMNGLQMQGNQAMNQRAMNFIGYLAQFNPEAARAASMAQIPIGR